MKRGVLPAGMAKPSAVRPPEKLRRLIEAAMQLERRTMQLYCRFETLFSAPAELRQFWFDMAQHESRHFGALALVAGLLESAPDRTLPAAPALTRAHVEALKSALDTAEREAHPGLALDRAFELALEVEGSEIEELVLDLLRVLKGEAERERAVRALIHDLGDLSYMIEKYSARPDLLARVDQIIEEQVDRLPGVRASRRAPGASRRKKKIARVGRSLSASN